MLASIETGVSRREARKDTRVALDNLRALANLLLSNGEFRGLISDSILFARDIFADAASAVADRASQAASAARPDAVEREKGVDLTKQKRNAKKAKKDYETGKYNVEMAKVEASVRTWVDEALPDADQAKSLFYQRLHAIVVQAQSNDQ